MYADDKKSENREKQNPWKIDDSKLVTEIKKAKDGNDKRG